MRGSASESSDSSRLLKMSADRSERPSQQAAPSDQKTELIRRLPATGRPDTAITTSRPDPLPNGRGSTGKDGLFPQRTTTNESVKRTCCERVPAKISQSLHLNVEINEMLTVKALIDSGATTDFIDAEIVRKLRIPTFELGMKAKTITATAGQSVPINRDATVLLRCNGLALKYGFMMYENLSEQMVLGLPFIKKHLGLLDLTNDDFNGVPFDGDHPTTVTLAGPTPVQEINMARLERHFKEPKNEVYTIYVRAIDFSPDSQANKVNPELFDLGTYADVVTSELPAGLPPKGIVQHQEEVTFAGDAQLGSSLNSGS